MKKAEHKEQPGILALGFVFAHTAHMRRFMPPGTEHHALHYHFLRHNSRLDFGGRGYRRKCVVGGPGFGRGSERRDIVRWKKKKNDGEEQLSSPQQCDLTEKRHSLSVVGKLHPDHHLRGAIASGMFVLGNMGTLRRTVGEEKVIVLIGLGPSRVLCFEVFLRFSVLLPPHLLGARSHSGGLYAGTRVTSNL